MLQSRGGGVNFSGGGVNFSGGGEGGWDPGGHCDLHYVAIFLKTSQILKFVDLRKTQKPRYLEKETLLFLQIKKI